MPRRIHQVKRISLAIFCGIFQAHGLRLDGNAPFALNIHIVENLLGHLALSEAATMLNQTVSKRGFAMVNMGNNRKIADFI